MILRPVRSASKTSSTTPVFFRILELNGAFLFERYLVVFKRDSINCPFGAAVLRRLAAALTPPPSTALLSDGPLPKNLLDG